MNIELTNENVTLLKQMASNLGIDDIKQGSYLNTLLRGLLTLNERTEENISSKIDNISIDTADEDTLEGYGARRNLPRLKNNEVSILAKEKGFVLKVDFYDYEADKNIKLFSAGDIVIADTLIVTFIEDVWYNTSLTEVYVSSNISVLEDVTVMQYLTAETNFQASVPLDYKDKIRSISLENKRDIFFSNFKENLEVYRSRLKHSMYSESIANKNGITILMNKIPYVSQYYIDETLSPFIIYILNSDMYKTKEIDSVLREQSIPFAEGVLDRYRGYSSSFSFELAERITYGIALDIPGQVDPELFSSIREQLTSEHRLGDFFSLSKTDVEYFLKSLGIEKTFNFKFYYSYNGVQFETPNPFLIEFEPKEFPFLEYLTINGEDINVHN